MAGDIKVEFTCSKVLQFGKEKLFHFWFNTFFVDETAEGEGISCRKQFLLENVSEEKCLNVSYIFVLVQNDGTLLYKLNKPELDDAHKDKGCKIFPPDFKVIYLNPIFL